MISVYLILWLCHTQDRSFVLKCLFFISEQIWKKQEYSPLQLGLLVRSSKAKDLLRNTSIFMEHSSIILHCGQHIKLSTNPGFLFTLQSPEYHRANLKQPGSLPFFGTLPVWILFPSRPTYMNQNGSRSKQPSPKL